MALRPRRRDPGNAGGWRVRSGLPRRLVEALQEQRNSTEEQEMHASRANLSQASSVATAGIRRWAGGARFPIEYACTVRWGRFFAPPGLQPRFYEPFMIVDSRLRLQAVSYHAGHAGGRRASSRRRHTRGIPGVPQRLGPTRSFRPGPARRRWIEVGHQGHDADRR